LLGLAGARAAVVAAVAVWLTTLSPRGAPTSDLLLVGAAAAAGCAAFGLQTHARRSRGWAAPGATALAAGLAWAGASVGEPWPWPLCLLLGLSIGAVGVALRALHPAAAAVEPSRWEPAWCAFRDAAATALLLFLLEGAQDDRFRPLGSPQAILLGAAAAFALLAAAAWVLLLPQTLELFAEFLFWPMYRIRARGPGAGRLPRTGPLLIVANHASYADPFWIGKIAPRKITPMMTSRFFDLPVIRWMMRRLVGAIRVPAAGFRREAPELRDAAAVLRRGGCLLIFPEGSLRHDEERPLRPFGQGVWHVLREAPETPVAVCWIEGGWGSFASYKGGKPFKNKRLDWRRPIDVAVAEPRPLDPAVLADQRATRDHLRQACAACRAHLGLPPPQGPARDDEVEKEGEKPPTGAGDADAHQINP
jgi:1-acyl-sn-glycerol-3-phosphate acyltransferase